MVPEDEPPGSTRRVRALHELLTTYDRTLADSMATSADLTPGSWRGPASEAYQEQAKNPFETQLRAIREINAAMLDAVERHQDFRVQLATLWQDPREREHMSRVYQSASDQLAEELLRNAAELDRLATFPEPAAADPVGLPAPVPIPRSRRVAEPPASPPHDEPYAEPDAEPDDPDPVAALDPNDEGTQDEDASADEGGQAGGTGHNGHGGVFRPVVPGVVRDETERAAWLRAPAPLDELRIDVKWEGDD